MGFCIVKGWRPLMYGAANSDLRVFNLSGRDVNRMQGGGIARGTFSLQRMYIDAKRDHCIFTRPTDGFDLVKYCGTKLFLQAHYALTYAFHWDTDYKNPGAFDYPWFHPSTIILKTNHVIVWSKNFKPGFKGKKIFIPRPSYMGDDWFFMKDMASVGLFQYHCTLLDVGNPFLAVRAVTTSIVLKGNTQTGQQPSFNSVTYQWDFDQGLFNSTAFTADPPPTRAGLAQGVPYYISLFGHTDETNIWIFTSSDWTEQGQRAWFKLDAGQAEALVRHGPWASKGVSQSFSFFCRYKAKFLFGGPSVTEFINPGQDPSEIPIGTQASTMLPGLQIRDPSTVGAGVAHRWELRRGLYTARALQRLTAGSPETIAGLQETLGEPTECEPSQEEEEASEESSWETETEG